MNKLVLDTSTLILLAKVDVLELVMSEVAIKISPVVQEESTRRKELSDAMLIERYIQDKKIKIIKISETTLVKKLMDDFKLGHGEAEAILLAKQEDAILGVDDGPAIKACKVIGVRWVCALSLLFRVYEKGLLSGNDILTKIERLKKVGWYQEDLLIKVISDIRQKEQAQ